MTTHITKTWFDGEKVVTQEIPESEVYKQEPVAWKLVPINPTDEMLKAMDACSTEGYDERLYAGHAASVYMAAVEAAPTPPQRTWMGLTDDEIYRIAFALNGEHWRKVANAIEAKLKEKNA
jgi:hypothetical protein